MGRMLAALALTLALTGCGPTAFLPVPTATQTTPAAVVIGQPARDGKLEFVVTNVSDSSAPNWYGPPGNWVFVQLNVRNIGDQSQTFFVANQKLVDSQGRAFDPDTTTWARSNDVSIASLNPGFDAAAALAFNLPAGVQPAAIELHDSAFSGGARVSLAGSG